MTSQVTQMISENIISLNPKPNTKVHVKWFVLWLNHIIWCKMS